jgi:hypothetical protein
LEEIKSNYQIIYKPKVGLLELYEKRPEGTKSMETAEIKNGRLAMIAITVYVIEEIITGQPVVQQTPFLF